MRWGEHLEYVAEAGPGDFIFIPPFVPHQEINASTDAPLSCVVVRSGQEAVVINLDIEPVERPEAVFWVDPIHRHPQGEDSSAAQVRPGSTAFADTLGLGQQRRITERRLNTAQVEIAEAARARDHRAGCVGDLLRGFVAQLISV